MFIRSPIASGISAVVLLITAPALAGDITGIPRIVDGDTVRSARQRSASTASMRRRRINSASCQRREVGLRRHLSRRAREILP